MTDDIELEVRLTDIRRSDAETTRLVNSALRSWLTRHAPTAATVVIMENSRGFGIQEVLDDDGAPVRIDHLPGSEQVDRLVFGYAQQTLDRDDYDWDEEDNKIWAVSIDSLDS